MSNRCRKERKQAKTNDTHTHTMMTIKQTKLERKYNNQP